MKDGKNPMDARTACLDKKATTPMACYLAAGTPIVPTPEQKKAFAMKQKMKAKKMKANMKGGAPKKEEMAAKK